jgi:hypothetical protein
LRGLCFGSGTIILSQSDGGAHGQSFQSHLAGHKGIYIMQADHPGTLFTGIDCLGGHNYFNADGGVAKITLWELN